MPRPYKSSANTRFAPTAISLSDRAPVRFDRIAFQSDIGCMGRKGRAGPAPPGTRKRAGFTLLQALLTTVIIVTGATAMVLLVATARVANADSAAITQAVQFAENIRELSLRLSFKDPQQPGHFGPERGESFATFDDVDDIEGFRSSSVGGPVDGRRQVMHDQKHWEQIVQVEPVDLNNLPQPAAPGSRPLLRVTVTVTRNGEIVHKARWLAGAFR